MTFLHHSTGPIAGRETATPAGEGDLLTAGRAGHSRRTNHSNRNRNRSTRCDCSSTRSWRAQLSPRSRCRSSHARNTAYRSKGRGSRQVQNEPGEILHSRRKRCYSSSPNRRNYCSSASEIAGAWETVTVSTLSYTSRLARRPHSFGRERSEEGGDRTRAVTTTSPVSRGSRTLSTRSVAVKKTATGHVESGLDPRIVTGLRESECNATGSGPKIAPRPLVGGQRPRRGPPPTLSTA